MSAFSTSPRPRIVNSVLIREYNDKNRCNGLQGTNSKEDFYRAIAELPSPIPKDDIQPDKSVSAACDLPCNYSLQENYSNLKNINRAVHFPQERRNITDHSETSSVHCDHRQTFVPQECEQKPPSFCTPSKSHNTSTLSKLDVRQDSVNYDTCCEGKHLTQIDKWESGDHHRFRRDDSPAPNEEGCHYPSDNCCYNIPSSLNKTHPKCIYKENSPQSARRDSAFEECQDHTRRHTCSHAHEAVLTENKPFLRTPNSTSLHEQAVGSSHGNTENSIASMNSEVSCKPQNDFPEPSSRNKYIQMQHGKPEYLKHPDVSSPEYLHIPQERRPQDEQPEYSKAIAREEFNIVEDPFEEFSGYPPQRRFIKQYNVPTEDENFSSHENQLKNHECRRLMRRKGQISNVTEREARSVAEILNHPVVDVHPVESEVLARQCSPPVRTLNSGEALGYPPQSEPLRKSKYSVHRTCENDSYNEEMPCNYDTQKRQVTGHKDNSNDSWTRAEGEHEQTYVAQGRNATCRNEHDGKNEHCRAYNKTDLHYPHMTKNEYEETIPMNSVQNTFCVNQENICRECSPLTFHPEAQEQLYHSHHCSSTQDEETNNFSLKKLPKEVKRQLHFHHRDEIINEVNSRRKNKELYAGNKKSSYRPVSARHEDESHGKENANLTRPSEHHGNENPLSNSVQHSDGYIETFGEDGHTLQCTAPHDELQERKREKCLAPISSYNYCEEERIRDSTHPHVSGLRSKATEGLEEYSTAPSCEVNKLNDNIAHTDRLCNPVKDSLGLSGLDEQCFTNLYRRKNGLEDEDTERTNAENRDISFEENNKADARKHGKLIPQDACQNATALNKCETTSKLNHAHSEERKDPSNLTPKTRIPKMKANLHSTSNKNNTAAPGCLQQRFKRATGLKF